MLNRKGTWVGAVLFWMIAISGYAQVNERDGSARKRVEIQRPLDACGSPEAKPINIFEVRAAERVDQDLMVVDGVNADRDIAIVACAKAIRDRFRSSFNTVYVETRAWHKPKEGGWREIRINEPSAAEVQAYRDDNTDEAFWRREEVTFKISVDTVLDPVVTVPLRRDGVKPEDLVRLRVRMTTTPPPLPAKQEAQRNADGGAPPNPAESAYRENEQVVDSTFEVGRFGLHVGFSDAVIFVQRLGEDRANKRGDRDILFDSVNFRPAPGISYGFNYYHRRHAFLKFLEPGFGANLTFLNWNEKSRSANTTLDSELANVTALQVGVGGTGSMFDGTVVAVLGWNLHVKDYRQYFGVGFSITGLVRKMSKFLR